MQRNYRIFIIMLLAVMLMAGGWLCYYSIQKNRVYEDATLVYRAIIKEVNAHEGKA